ncbi:uncharacterized protein BO88DRAFT_222186 [Aspergillus vadensis CBS 113365]|uniref:Uncharacterized protein n=1 Tax=Aspergillus vadensis (strain CBS 113365 / IMI 142717 / IBT 24658) TaxID=1448311 RepID=A0A319AVF1_ASPVC|nr:hypothetical protein BO88DRAFT_222186 [Aspergillus vadensis CBS 113365]PYH63341.1 hypothetical protein BO88DRAFT_222186 [Aspergillus vadensis CBS 113365]
MQHHKVLAAVQHSRQLQGSDTHGEEQGIMGTDTKHKLWSLSSCPDMTAVSTVSRLDSLRTYSQGEIYELIESTISEIPTPMTA